MIFQAIGKQIAHHHYCSVWQFTVFETRLKLKQSNSNWRRVHILYVNLFVPIRLHYGLPAQYIFMLIAFKWKHLKKIALRKWESERGQSIFSLPPRVHCTLPPIHYAIDMTRAQCKAFNTCKVVYCIWLGERWWTVAII